MTTASRKATSRLWVLPFLAALVAILATVFGAATASAATTGTAETRVRAHNGVVDVLVEPPQHETAGQQLGNNAAGPETAVATGVAAKSESGVGRLLGGRVRDERGSFGLPGGASRLTNAQAADMASRVGYTKTNYIVRGQSVFSDGKTFIVQDTTAHSGGLWKMGKSVDALNSKGTRLGTYDYDLNYIGP